MAVGSVAAERVDCIIIGAGVVGLAVARALALAGREVLVLESEEGIGTGVSSRNSEVIHAGIYYTPGSLKARLCVQGKNLLYRYCQERGIGHLRCGKLLVATDHDQVPQLQGIIDKSRLNGVGGDGSDSGAKSADSLVLLTGQQARAMEPALHCVGAIHSPGTGIVDSHAFMLGLQGDLENAGGLVVLHARVVRGDCLADGIELTTQDGTRLLANTVVNSAGLHAVALARKLNGLNRGSLPPAYFCKGNYFTLTGRSPFSRLIYPVPQAAGLGVHLTLDMGGQAKFGPDVEWVESADDLTVDASRGEAFYTEVRKYWPDLKDGALIPGYCGIRPKINAPHEMARDFMIQGPADHGVPGLVNLFGIESPGLTSALAIGGFVLNLIQGA